MTRWVAVLPVLAALVFGAASVLASPEQAPIRATIADLIAQPWKYHGKTVQVSGIARYVFNGRGSRMHLGPDREEENHIDIDSEESGAIWLPRYRYNWASVELTALFDG